jgi:hypothetical protein
VIGRLLPSRSWRLLRASSSIDYESMERWEAPHENDELSDEDNEGVIENMRRAFAPRGYTVELMNEPTGRPSATSDIRAR